MNVQMKIDLGVYFLAVVVVLMIARNAIRVEAEFEAKRREASKRFGLAEAALPAVSLMASPQPEPRTEDRVDRERQLMPVSFS